MKRMVFSRQQLLFLSGGCLLLMGLMLFFWVYLPLGSRLQKVGKELSKVQLQLTQARETLHSLKTTQPASLRLPGQKELSSVIEEMTQLGKGLGVDFRSIHPRPAAKETEGTSRLSIEMRLESFYRELGLFMGSLRKLEKSTVTVESFDVQREEEVFPRLRCHLVVKVALRP